MDPELAAIARHLPPPEMGDVGAARRRVQQMLEAGADRLDRSWTERVTVFARDIPGPDGNAVPVRVYTPGRGVGRHGALVHFHGGAFVVGDLDLSESTVARYADRAGVVVVDVDYRLAPEHPYPAGFEDCYRAVEWTAEHADELGVDSGRIGVGGNSAGGGLAAAVALAARDRGGPSLLFQLLLYPVLDDRLVTRSIREMTDTPMWTAASAVHMWRYYLGDQAGVADAPVYAAPMRAALTADGLHGLPPAYLLACELDPLRDENIAYAAALLDAGISVDLHVVAGAYHGFDELPTSLSRRTTDELIDVLRRALT